MNIQYKRKALHGTVTGTENSILAQDSYAAALWCHLQEGNLQQSPGPAFESRPFQASLQGGSREARLPLINGWQA